MAVPFCLAPKGIKSESLKEDIAVRQQNSYTNQNGDDLPGFLMLKHFITLSLVV